MPTCLSVFCDGFHVTVGELHGWDRDHVVCIKEKKTYYLSLYGKSLPQFSSVQLLSRV